MEDVFFINIRLLIKIFVINMIILYFLYNV